MALVWIGNKVEKISKNSQILYWNFKFLVKIEIYVTGPVTLLSPHSEIASLIFIWFFAES